jgi:alanyl-tRNA synthetase
MHCAEIRQRFVEYYQQRDFQLLPRASMLHPSIPMSFVMSAGLVQVETSLAKTKNRSGNKFVLVQDCFRHFDLDKIGKDNVHLSLFEMPAAFVFGEDTERNAIKYIWELTTNVLGIDPQKLWVSYFEGDEVEGHRVTEDTLSGSIGERATRGLRNMRAIYIFAHPTGDTGEKRRRAISRTQTSCQPGQRLCREATQGSFNQRD